MTTTPNNQPDEVDEIDFETVAAKRMAELVPVVDAPAMALIYNVVRLANRIVTDIESQVHNAAGWSWAGFRIMYVVLIFGELEPRQISVFADVSRASVSSALNTLERDGLVVRLRESEDRRLVTVKLTDRGTEMVTNAFVAHNEREREWASSLSAQESGQLTNLVRRMLSEGPSAS